jgi:hypothetical protein
LTWREGFDARITGGEDSCARAVHEFIGERLLEIAHAFL